MNQKKTYTFVNDLWNQKEADTLDPLGKLVYRSNLLGSDQRITNTGGGNTSAKINERDPLTGESTEVLWVKGSGGYFAYIPERKFCLIVSGKTPLAAAGLFPGRPSGAEDTG